MQSLGSRRDLRKRIPGGCDELRVYAGLSEDDRGLFQEGPLLCARLVWDRLKP